MALFSGVRSAIRSQHLTLSGSFIMRETMIDSLFWAKNVSSFCRTPYSTSLLQIMANNEPGLMKYFLTNGETPSDARKMFSSFSATHHAKPINKSMSLKVIKASPEQAKVWKDKQSQPVVVLYSWMLAKSRHIQRHAEIYLKQGFDVITLELRPFHMLFPEKGAQPLAEELLDYLVDHTSRRPLFLHGFSVGAYFHGELLEKMRSHPIKYSGVERRIRGQIWDSIVDYDHIPIGFPKAVTGNGVVQKALEIYIRCHMKAMSNKATQYYLRSSKVFQDTPIAVPALFFASLADPVGVAYKIEDCAERWSATHGIPTYVKVWNESKHVSHYHMHPKEYQAELAAFLDHLGFLPCPELVVSFHHEKLPTEVSKKHASPIHRGTKTVDDRVPAV